MNAKQSILNKITDGTFALLTDVQIAKKLRLGKRESLGLKDMLDSLVRDGLLFSDSRSRYGTAEQFGAKKGKISGNERGFGFFMPEDGSPDLFLPRKSLRGALHGDTVLAIRVGGRSDDEGEVLAVLERGYSEVVGTFRKEGKLCYLRPDERKLSTEIRIPLSKSAHCADGVKAVAKITSYADGTPVGVIVEVLGDGDDFFVEELSLIRAHKLREEFPDGVLSAAEQQERRSITEKDLLRRVDLRQTLIVTVDGEDTRDIDDAVSVEKKDGVFHLGVHIADVSHYVARGSVIDEEAFRRGTSVYFPDRVLPMLPKQLSNGICSLNEGVDRLTLSCFMTVDGRGRVLSRKVAPSVIRSAHRMTYTEVTKLYEGDGETVAKYPDLIDFVQTAIELTNILKTARENRGGVAMDVKEAKILWQDGKIVIPDYDRSVSHEMIEQFMVLANESVASLMSEKNYPFVYRVHERPSPEKAEGFKEFLEDAGIGVRFDPDRVSPADYRDLLNGLKRSPLYSVVNRVMLRSMMKAKYSPSNVGHFGLASDCYCHFTSPIRRYPDLCVHRIVKQSLTDPESVKKQFDSFVSRAAVQASECEKNATEAERDVDALYTVAYMQDKIGEEYDAVISGVTSFGVFAELSNTIEGLVSIDLLPDDRYEFIEEKFLLRGTKNSFRIGEGVRVKVAGVDWGARRTQFQYLGKLSPNGKEASS
ncbi:MAG: ribonuclease R [Candidatus Gallimonas sp.]